MTYITNVVKINTCLQCMHNVAGHFNCATSLTRICACAPNIINMKKQAQSEEQLMLFYHISLPAINQPSPNEAGVHSPSVDLLHDHSQLLLSKFIPGAVQADGNCLFRSLSLAMYESELHYMHLRLLATIETLMHACLYDQTSLEYYAAYKCDEELLLPCFDTFVCELGKNCAHSDMLSVLYLSAVIQKSL